MFIKKNYTPYLILLVLSAVLVAIQWNNLALPCFWDESFPYSYAFRYLVDNGITLAPSGMPELYSTGHPTLFYALVASWMKIVGVENMMLIRLLPLGISILILFATYLLGKKYLNEAAGILAATLLCTRAAFVANSIQLLPEVLVTLLSILTISAWAGKRKTAYVAWASLLLLTKEPGIILIIALALTDLFYFLKERKESFAHFIRDHLFLLLPIIPIALFFIAQKNYFGWYLFPRHTGFFEFTPAAIYDKARGFSHILFVFNGGVFISLVLILAVVYILIKKAKLEMPRMVVALFVFSIAYYAFCCTNFFSPRYILCLYPILYLLAAYLALIAFQNQRQIISIILVGIAGIQLVYIITVRGMGDDLGYVDTLTTQQKAIRWCVENNYQDSTIYARHQLYRAMGSDAPGYVTKSEIFTKVSSLLDNNPSLYIITSNERGAKEKEIDTNKLIKIIRFEQGEGWTEIYKR